jgi:hypothetical protein
MSKIRTTSKTLAARVGGVLGASAIAAAGLTACASKPAAQAPFTGAAPFSRAIAGPSDSVCWSVKRALLSQGYMLDRSTEPGALTGSRDYQPAEKINVTVHLQTTCADKRPAPAKGLVAYLVRGFDSFEQVSGPARRAGPLFN